MFSIFMPSELNSDCFNVFFAKHIIAKQFQVLADQVHVHISRADGEGALKQQRGFRAVYGASEQRGSPLVTCLHVHTHVSYNVHNLLPIFVQIES